MTSSGEQIKVITLRFLILQVLPIENQMRRPKDMLGINGVLNTSMALVLALYVAMGFYGYLKYGEDIEASITLNLPPGDM